jgi:hypothetical protein
MQYGMSKNAANDRARNITSVGTTGERITSAIANEMLMPTKVIVGISDNKIRHEAAIELARHWVANTSDSASNSWMRLHLQLRMTRFGAAKWLHENGYISEVLKNSLLDAGHRTAKYHGGSMQYCVSKLERSVRLLKERSKTNEKTL